MKIEEKDAKIKEKIQEIDYINSWIKTLETENKELREELYRLKEVMKESKTPKKQGNQPYEVKKGGNLEIEHLYSKVKSTFRVRPWTGAMPRPATLAK